MTKLFDALFARADAEILVWVDGEPWVHMRAVCRALGYNYTAQWAQLHGKKSLRFVAQPMEFRKIRLLGADGKRRLGSCLHARDFLYWMLVNEPKPGKGAAHLKPLIDQYRVEATDALWRGRYAAVFKAIPLDGAPRIDGAAR